MFALAAPMGLLSAGASHLALKRRTERPLAKYQ